MTPGSIRVRAAKAADVEALVSVHVRAFEGFFLTLLGEKFLRRLYTTFIEHHDVICQVVENPHEVCGFAVGPLNPRGYFKALLLHQGFGFALDALPRLIRNPVVVGRRLLSALFYRGAQPAVTPRAALLSSLAILPELRGTGASGLLIEAFCREAARYSATHVYATTDRDANNAANRFYVKHGFSLESSIVRSDGRVMNRYYRLLTKSARSTP